MKGLLKKAVICLLSVSVIALSFGGSDVLAKGKKKAAATHNVTYIYGLKTVTVPVAHGQNAPVPTDTYVAGYNFTGWVGNAMNVTEDRFILGAYTKAAAPQPYCYFNTYTGGYKSGRKINSNKSAPQPDWWGTINLQKGTPGKTCAVYWLNGHNGELWKTDIVPYGSSLPTPDDPCIAGYEFMGWEGDWTNITEDRVIKAWYFTTHKIYFECDFCGEGLGDRTIHDGDGCWIDPHDHGDKGKKFDGYYTSDGWKYDGGGLTKDLTLHARYVDKEKD